MDRLNISVLGNFQMEMNGKNILDKLSQKGSGLLIYLILSGEDKISRDRLASLFWGDSSEDAARYNLRYNLWMIRKTLDKREDIIGGDKNYCQAKLVEELKVDVIEFEGLLKNQEERLTSLEEAKKLYKGDFLENFFLKDCIEFNDWVFFKKEEHQRQYYNLILELTGIYRENSQYEDAILAINDLLKINPLDEKLYVKLIDIHLEKGDRASAFKVYNRCVEVLREELNISPSKETKEAYSRVMSGEEVVEKIQPKEEIKDLNNDEFIFGELGGGEKISLDLLTYPSKSHEYYILTQLVEGLILDSRKINLKDFPRYYLRDLLHITNLILEIDEKASYENITNESTLKNKIYRSSMELIKYYLKKISIDIRINRVEYIDDYSFDFFLMLIGQTRGKNIRILMESSIEEDSDLRPGRVNLLNNL